MSAAGLGENSQQGPPARASTDPTVMPLVPTHGTSPTVSWERGDLCIICPLYSAPSYFQKASEEAQVQG